MEKSNDLAAKVYDKRPFLPVEAQFFTDTRAREKELKRIDEARALSYKLRKKNGVEYTVISAKIEKCCAEIIDLEAKLSAVNISIQDALAESSPVKDLEGAVIDLSRDSQTLKNAKTGFERKQKTLAETDNRLADEIEDATNREKQIIAIGLAVAVNEALSAVSKTLWQLNSTIVSENPYTKEGTKLWDSIFWHTGFSFDFCQVLPKLRFKNGTAEEIEALKKTARPFDGFFYHIQRDHVAGPNQIPRPDHNVQSPFLHS